VRGKGQAGVAPWIVSVGLLQSSGTVQGAHHRLPFFDSLWCTPRWLSIGELWVIMR
jgi:hypothetical protein